jgi:Raf kinase inhibitor-like YbhB/YbcL family protein
MNFPTVAPFPFDTYDHVINADQKFELTSPDLVEGGELAAPQQSDFGGVPGGQDVSPALEWSGFPVETKSFVVTCYDPDAPVVSGIWHWVMYDVPAHIVALMADTGNADGSNIPLGAKVLKNDAGFRGYLGAAAPPSHGQHRYIFCVTAMAVETIPDVTADTSPAWLHGRMMRAGVLGRGFLTGVFGR